MPWRSPKALTSADWQNHGTINRERNRGERKVGGLIMVGGEGPSRRD